MEPVGAIVLRCPGCGARLEIHPEMARFACGSCGCALVALRRGGTVALVAEEALRPAGARSDKAAAELALQRLPDELAARQRDLEEKARTLQYLKQHLNDDPGGFEFKARHGVWSTLWKSAVVAGVLVLVVLAKQREALALRDLVLGVVIPFGLGFAVRHLLNRKVAAHNAQVAKAREEAIRLSQAQVQRRIQAAQREHDEAARQVAALVERIARNKAIADT
jgi:hypothetical protein